MKIRPIEPERDADDIVELVRATRPLQLTNREVWLHGARSVPERIRLSSVVAEIGGKVVGEARTGYGFFSEKNAVISVRVHPDHRRRGIGRELFEAIRGPTLDLNVEEILVMFDETEDGVRFAQVRGFGEVRGELWSVLDTRSVTEHPDPAVDLAPARDLDPHDLYRVDIETMRDMPLHEPFESMDYEEWLNAVVRSPFFTTDGSFGALVEGRVVSISLLFVDPATRRGANMMTGTLAPFRGRGLARAVKLASISWAAANGIDRLATTNDETNAPMLAVNRRLGYRPAARLVEYLAKRERLLRERGEDL